MIFLGIDPGIRCTGAALVDMSQQVPELLHVASIRSPDRSPDHVAREFLSRRLLETVSIWMAHRITAAGIEDYEWQGPRSANENAFRISKLVGRFEEALNCHRPQLISKGYCNAMIGRGGECSKADVKRGLSLVFRGDVGRNEHERDAILVAYALGRMWRARRRFAPAKETEVVR